jgi:hypothetical protein
MLNTVKNAMHTIGDGTEDFAKRFGGEAADIAKLVGSEAACLAKSFGAGTADLAKSFGAGTADLAKSFGAGTADLAKRIGPKRAIIGVAVLGVLVGGSIWLARYLRARKEELPTEGTEEQQPNRGHKRHGKRGAEHYSH